MNFSIIPPAALPDQLTVAWRHATAQKTSEIGREAPRDDQKRIPNSVAWCLAATYHVKRKLQRCHRETPRD